MPGALNRFAPLAQLAHHPQAFAVYDAMWVVLLIAAVPFALRLRQAAHAIDRRIRWEAETLQRGQ